MSKNETLEIEKIEEAEVIESRPERSFVGKIWFWTKISGGIVVLALVVLLVIYVYSLASTRFSNSGQLTETLEIGDKPVYVNIPTAEILVETGAENTLQIELFGKENILNRINTKNRANLASIKFNSWFFYHPNSERFAVEGKIILPKNTNLEISSIGTSRITIRGLGSELVVNLQDDGFVSTGPEKLSGLELNLRDTARAAIGNVGGEVNLNLNTDGNVEIEMADIDELNVKTSKRGRFEVKGGLILNANIVHNGSGTINLPTVRNDLQQENNSSGTILFTN